jgi:8-oxo-dGTP pyrophosphatase MutT (NUDIX family)
VVREVLEETGLRVDASGVAFLLETTDPAGERRLVELVFLASEPAGQIAPRVLEPGLEPVFVPVEDTPGLILRPPLAGYLRGLHRERRPSTAAYLGNLWRSTDDGSQDGADR